MNLTKRTRPKGLWMHLTEEKRKQLLKLMTIQEVSGRELAKAAGWRSHTYLQRLLRGEVRTLDTGPAVAIALYLGVGVDDLFLARRSTESGRRVAQKGAA